MQRLSLRFTSDQAGDTQLRATVETQDFKGTGRYWLPTREMEAFCEALSAYPIPLGDSVSGRWYEERLIIEVKAVNAVGDLIARVRIADFANDWNVCQLLLQVKYSSLDRFRNELRAIIAAGEGEATLLE